MRSLLLKAALLVVVFVVVTGIASLAGAANLGTAMTFGQVAFALTLVGLMLGAPRRVDGARQPRDAAPRD